MLQIQTQNAQAKKALEYLLNEDNPNRVNVQIEGAKRTIFVNFRDTDHPAFGILNKGSRRSGKFFYEWESIEKVFIPLQGKEAEDARRQKFIDIVRKCKKIAKTATFTNRFIRQYANADENKTLWENGIGIDGPHEGKLLKLSTIEKKSPAKYIEEYKQALKDKTKYISPDFEFNGYRGYLSVNLYEGEPVGYFHKEYKHYGNSYQYIAISDDCFVEIGKD